MKTCYIIGAAEMAAGRFRPGEDDIIIAADAGLLHLARLGIKPDLMLGDFDSLGYVPSGGNVEVCPVRKDDTDTMAALRRALDFGCERALIFGGLGGRRFDHSLANVQALAWAETHGLEAFLVGQGCCLTALSGGQKLSFEPKYSGDFSVFCLGAPAGGICETGLNYALDNAALEPSFPLGVSNAFTGQRAELSVHNGLLIVYWQDDPALPLPVRSRIYFD